MFASAKFKHAALDSSPDDFYKVACSVSDDLVGLELFRKLINGYSGQGESERMNKQVKKHRTTIRNPQQHDCTAALMELETTYRMIESRKHKPAEVMYIDRLQETFRNVQEELEEEAQERIYNNATALDDNADSDNEGDDDYQIEAPDIGRNALIDLLLSAASALDENNID